MDTEIREIISGLLEKSKKHKVNWIHSGDIYPSVPPSADDYSVNLERSSINIFKDPPKDIIVFTIKNISGKTIVEEHCELFDDGYSMLRELIELAANKADEVDETLESIKDELNTSGEIGIKHNSIDNSDEIPF